MIPLDMSKEFTMAPVHIPGPNVPRLSDMCRAKIRSVVREAVGMTHELKMRSIVGKKAEDGSETNQESRERERGPVIIFGERLMQIIDSILFASNLNASFQEIRQQTRTKKRRNGAPQSVVASDLVRSLPC